MNMAMSCEECFMRREMYGETVDYKKHYTPEQLNEATEAIEKRIYDTYVAKHQCNTCAHRTFGPKGWHEMAEDYCVRIRGYVADDFHCMLWKERK